MDTNDKSKAMMDAFQAKVDAGEPIMTYFIEPPLTIKVEQNVVHVDAPCLAVGGSDKAAVMRITFSAQAAKGMKNFFASLEVTEDGSQSGSAIQ